MVEPAIPPHIGHDPAALDRLDAALADLSLREALVMMVGQVPPGRLAVVSAFGPGSLVVLHELHTAGIRLPVIFVDTLHHFPETLEHVERVRARYDLDLRIFRHVENRERFEARYGPRLWERDLDRYQERSKVEPFRRATAPLDGWITGRRREQSSTRAMLPLVEGGPQLRFNPLANWTHAEVWRFILEQEIPYNDLHDRGYRSIGDEPLTTAIEAGEEERAGRWRGSGRTECGIHLI